MIENQINLIKEPLIIEQEAFKKLKNFLQKINLKEEDLYTTLCLNKIDDDNERKLSLNPKGFEINKTLSNFRKNKIQNLFSQTMKPFYSKLDKSELSEDPFEIDLKNIRETFDHVDIVKEDIQQMVDEFLNDISPDPEDFFKVSSKIYLEENKKILDYDYEEHERNVLEKEVGGLTSKLVLRRKKIIQLFYKDILMEYNKQIKNIKLGSIKIEKQKKSEIQHSQKRKNDKKDLEKKVRTNLNQELNSVLKKLNKQHHDKIYILNLERDKISKSIEKINSNLNQMGNYFKNKISIHNSKRDLIFQERIKNKKQEYEDLLNEYNYLKNLNDENEESNKQLLEEFIKKREILWEKYKIEEKEYIHQKFVPDIKGREYRNLFNEIENNSMIISRLKQNLNKMHKLKDSYHQDIPNSNHIRKKPKKNSIMKFKQMLEEQTNNQINKQIVEERTRFNSLLGTKQKSNFLLKELEK